MFDLARGAAFAAAVALLAVQPATAAAVTLAPGANVGIIDVVAIPRPAHVGLYPYVAASVAIIEGRVSIIPSLGAEASTAGYWGLTAGVVLDVALTSTLGADLLVTFIHDQENADWENALFLLGGGLGLSWTFRGLVVSPSVSVFRGLNLPVWTFVPGLNLGVPL